MLRVISGTARNLLLKTPDGLDTRPTTDRIKETLFNMIQFDIPGKIVIDLFAGSGSIGIEALSRGASHAYFVENNRQASECIIDNIKHTKLEDKSTVLAVDAFTSLSMIHESHIDIVFMDPPYDKGLEPLMLNAFKEIPYIDEDTLFIIEARIDTDFSFASTMGYTVSKEKKYKTNKHVFLYKL